jgi:two-component sensor histidine kinase
LAVSRDVTEQQVAKEALEIAAAEMKHRLKNTYMTISSLITGFARGDKVREAFALEMAERLVALSTAQSLFTMDEASCQIEILIPALLTPFDNPACAVTIEKVSPATITQGQADAIALVVGELSVNSAKHGALCHGGSVHVSADTQADCLRIDWRETSEVPPADYDRVGGQGLRIIDRIVRARGGTIEFNWTPSGLDVLLCFPLN